MPPVRRIQQAACLEGAMGTREMTKNAFQTLKADEKRIKDEFQEHRIVCYLQVDDMWTVRRMLGKRDG